MMKLIIDPSCRATYLPQAGLYRFLVSSVFLLTLLGSGTPVCPATPKFLHDVAPTTVSIRLSADGLRSYTTLLKDRQGKPILRLLIEPNTSLGDNIANWELGLFDPGLKGVDKRNLLAPAIWHGIQRFHFDATTINWPIEQGYGRIRVFHVLSSFTVLVVVDNFQTDAATDSMHGLVLTLYVIPDQ